MGVLTLDSYIRKNFSKTVKYYNKNQRVEEKFYTLALDANPFIYNSVYQAFETGPCETMLPQYSELTYEEKILKVYEFTWLEIVKIISMVDCQEIFIAFDGVAPKNKLNQQRMRRFGRPFSPEGFDLCNISPGTKFMKDLCIYIKHQIHLSSFNKIIFSDCTVPGEGEHKIMDYFRSLDSNHLENKKVCMYGPDGDLIMLGLISNLDFYLFKVDFSTQYQTPRWYTIEMKSLRAEISEALSTDISTFVFLCFLLGNDFIPRLEIFYLFYSGIGDLYKYVDQKLFTGKNINLLALFEKIAKDEPMLIQKRTDHPYPLLEKHGKDFQGFRQEYYKEWLHVKNIQKVCIQYLDTLWWNWLYYTKGCPTFDHCYPHHYPPFVCDLAEALKTWKPPAFVYKPALLPFHQLVYIMPESRKHLVPEKYHKYFTDVGEIKKNVQGRHPKFDVVYEVPIPKEFNIDVSHDNYHTRNRIGKNRIFIKGKIKYTYCTKFGKVETFISG